MRKQAHVVIKEAHSDTPNALYLELGPCGPIPVSVGEIIDTKPGNSHINATKSSDISRARSYRIQSISWKILLVDDEIEDLHQIIVVQKRWV